MKVNAASPNVATRGTPPSPAFIYRHVVSFEETNVVGNVYFTRHIAWQGRCREMFLKQHAPEILDQIVRDLRIVTLRVSCEYFEELVAFDEVNVRMSLSHVRQHRIGLDFEVIKLNAKRTHIVAHGSQELGCMRVTECGLQPEPLPPSLRQALKPFAQSFSAMRAIESVTP